MPQALIVIFLLFFAVLAFGWFYWQRAKVRDAGKTASHTDAAVSSSSSDQQ
jgi:predicted negative regulator of RcsB-dependent stress response